MKMYLKNIGFIEGYNKSQQSHPFNKIDMVLFSNWLKEVTNSIAYNDKDCPRLYKKSTEELLEIWIDNHQMETIYFM